MITKMKSVIAILCLFLLGCRFVVNKDTNLKVRVQEQITTCSKSILIDTFQQKFISLNYNEFDTSKIRSVFRKPFVYMVTENYQNERSFMCNFKSDSSEIYFFARGQKLTYFLDYAKITDNSILMNYDIVIGMSKERFFLNIKQPIIDCDSIKITEIGSLSLFIFNRNRLKEILLTTTI